MVALTTSLRLMAGALAFDQALAVLVLTPEFFLPLRQMAVKYHMGTAGKAAGERVFAVLDGQGKEGKVGKEGQRDRGAGGRSDASFPARAGLLTEPALSSSARAGLPTEPVLRSPARAGLPTEPAPRSPAWAGLPTEPAPRFDLGFDDVWYAYPAKPNRRQALDGLPPSEGATRAALQGFSCAIPHGQTTALVGATGAGKSTVANLLLRFIDADAGQITVGGVRLDNIDCAAWRRQVAYVPQLPHIFHGTALDNIRLARPEASLDQVIAAAGAARAHDFILALPQGYDTPLGEGGARLSGGQRQRLALARAFLKDAPVLLLDEATASLDAESEALIRDALARLMAGRTVLLIAHRLELAFDAHQIVVLHAGRAVETGNHATLLAQDGPYAHLVHSYTNDE
jgi:ABC-type multidrug transport system fused ATPase/permease subunit